MNPNQLYNALCYGFPLVGAIIGIVIVFNSFPIFGQVDICSQEYVKSHSNGQPTFYDQPNSKELIQTCYNVKNVETNPFLDYVIMFSIFYVFMRYLYLGSRSEFIKNNPKPQWRWEQ